MPAYLIVYANVSDPAQYDRYVSAVMPLIQSHGGRLTAANVPESVEGDFPWQHAVVFEWPTRQAALDFWHSPEYAVTKKLRAGAAELQAIVVEGIHPG